MKTRNIFTVLTLYCLLCLLKPCIVYAQGVTHGIVQNISFFSPSLGAERNVQVYLPYDYNPGDTITRYPVIYFLHGAGGNQTSFPYLIQILDTLISENTIVSVIVVKPDGSVPPYSGSFYTNSVLYGRFEDYIVYDLVSFIDSAYNTDADRTERCIMGHSMGGYGSMKLALKHPDIYCAVASHSGPLDFTHYTDAMDSLLAEYPGGPPYQYNPNAGIFSNLAFSMAGAFSPNLENPPYLVDFILDSLGNPIDSTINKWLQHSPAHLANYVSSDSVPSIYFDCGMEDQLTLLGWNTGFRDTLDEIGLPYTFVTFHGNHENHLINRLRVSLIFLDSVMEPTTVALESLSGNSPIDFSLQQNYPNPFNPTTKISWQSPVSGWQTLKVYDILGREVATLVNEYKLAGKYQIEFNAANLPSGVYFYQLLVPDLRSKDGIAGSYNETKKMILMK